MATHTRKGTPKISVWVGDLNPERLDISSDCYSFKTSKKLGPAAGTFSLVLVPRQLDGTQSVADIRRRMLLYRAIKSNTLISIGMQEAGGIMLGLVNRVSKSATFGGPGVTFSLTISGQDLGKVLATDNVIRATLISSEAPKFKADVQAALGADHPLSVDIGGVWGPENQAGINDFRGATIKDAVDYLLNNAASFRVPILAKATGGDGRPSDYIDTSRTITTWNDGRIWGDDPVDYEGTLWPYIQGIVDSDFYETFIETIPSGDHLPGVALIMRPKPFDEPDLDFLPTTDTTGYGWNDLRTLLDGDPYQEIELSEVTQMNLGTDDTQAFAYYNVTALHELVGNPDGLKEGLVYPAADLYIAKKFGMKAYRARSTLIAGDVSAKAAGLIDYDDDVRTEVHNLRNRLLNWYRLNPWFETGSITIVGRDKMRIGDPVSLPWASPPIGDEIGLRYYCVGVSQGWTVGGHYLTTVELTRGHNGDMISTIKGLIQLDGAFIVPPNLSNIAET